MKKKSATQNAYEKIKNMIINQELLPGQPIVEASFASKLNMSRTPIRAAIQLLQEDGLVELVLNKGTFVKSFTKNDIILCFEMVEALEGMATYLTTEKYKSGNLIKRDLIHLKKLIKKMDEALDVLNLNAWSKSDEEFHNEITKLCGNHYIRDEYARLRTHLNCVLWFITPMYIDKRASNKEHHMIFEAIMEKNPDKARQIAQNHRNRVRKELMHLLQ